MTPTSEVVLEDLTISGNTNYTKTKQCVSITDTIAVSIATTDLDGVLPFYLQKWDDAGWADITDPTDDTAVLSNEKLQADGVQTWVFASTSSDCLYRLKFDTTGITGTIDKVVITA